MVSMDVVRVLAIDLGASSGRGIVFEYSGGKIKETTVHRFENGAILKDGKYVWDIEKLFSGVKNSIKLANEKVGKLDSVGIDTWGVDFGLLDRDGKLLGYPRCYRDEANGVMRRKLQDDDYDFFSMAGISINDFNTTYQLAVLSEEVQNWDDVSCLLFMPQLIGYMLTGKTSVEPTIASTSGIFDLETGFNERFLSRYRIPKRIFPNVKKTGDILGQIKAEIKAECNINYELPVVLTAGHDTACAVLGVPSKDETLYLSSGTWSLFGTIVDKAVINKVTYDNLYTNELAFDGRVRLLKNIIGMWIIGECKKEWDKAGINLPYDEIVERAKKAKKYAVIDVNAPEFFTHGNMLDKIKDYAKTYQNIELDGVGEIAKTVYYSMAIAYEKAYHDLCKITNKRYERLHIIGGGANNYYLNELIAETLKIPVWAGPVEASALGNALGQLLGIKVIEKEQVKDVIINSYFVKIFDVN